MRRHVCRVPCADWRGVQGSGTRLSGTRLCLCMLAAVHLPGLGKFATCWCSVPVAAVCSRTTTSSGTRSMRTPRTAGSASPPSSCTCELRISSHVQVVTLSCQLGHAAAAVGVHAAHLECCCWSMSAQLTPDVIWQDDAGGGWRDGVPTGQARHERRRVVRLRQGGVALPGLRLTTLSAGDAQCCTVAATSGGAASGHLADRTESA